MMRKNGSGARRWKSTSFICVCLYFGVRKVNNFKESSLHSCFKWSFVEPCQTLMLQDDLLLQRANHSHSGHLGVWQSMVLGSCCTWSPRNKAVRQRITTKYTSRPTKTDTHVYLNSHCLPRPGWECVKSVEVRTLWKCAALGCEASDCRTCHGYGTEEFVYKSCMLTQRIQQTSTNCRQKCWRCWNVFQRRDLLCPSFWVL